MPAARPVRNRTLLLYAQDNQGLGHVTRTLTLARHVLARHPDCIAYIATKSPLAGFTLPERCDYIKLPTLLTAGTVRPTAAEEEAAKQHFRTIRGAILRDAVLGLVPDLVLVDHEPLGSKGEFRDGLWALKAKHPDTRFVFGLRDIMDDAARIRAAWEELGVYDALENLYDGIAVYGSPD
ncbi:MAG: glycosyltransferase, partial [Betaproteobacteria bacterium]